MDTKPSAKILPLLEKVRGKEIDWPTILGTKRSAVTCKESIKLRNPGQTSPEVKKERCQWHHLMSCKNKK